MFRYLISIAIRLLRQCMHEVHTSLSPMRIARISGANIFTFAFCTRTRLDGCACVRMSSDFFCFPFILPHGEGSAPAHVEHATQ